MWLWYFLIILTFCSYITQFLRSWRLFKMAIYQPWQFISHSLCHWWCNNHGFDLIPCTFGFWYYLVHCQETAIYHVRRHSAKLETIQEADCYLHPVSLKSSVTGALEEYVSRRRYSWTHWVKVVDVLEKKSLIAKPSTFKSYVSRRCQTCTLSIHPLKIRTWH